MQLWRRLERTRQMLGGQYKRFCIRNVLKSWFGPLATDDFIWEVCHNVVVNDEQVCGTESIDDFAMLSGWDLSWTSQA